MSDTRAKVSGIVNGQVRVAAGDETKALVPGESLGEVVHGRLDAFEWPVQDVSDVVQAHRLAEGQARTA